MSADECACTMCCECLDRVEFSPDGTIGGREAEKALEAKVSADIQRWFAERAVIEAAKQLRDAEDASVAAYEVKEDVEWARGMAATHAAWLNAKGRLFAAVATLRELEGEV